MIGTAVESRREGIDRIDWLEEGFFLDAGVGNQGNQGGDGVWGVPGLL